MLFRGNFGPNSVLPFSNPGNVTMAQASQYQTVGAFRLYNYWPLNYASYEHWGSEANSVYNVFSAPNIAAGGSVTPNSGATTTVGAVIGDSAVAFDGTGWLQGVTSAAAPSGGASRAFCCWVNPPNFTATFSAIGFGGSSAFTFFEVQLNKSSGGFAGAPVGALCLAAGGTSVMTSGTGLVAGVPSHIAVSFATLLSSATLFINGIQQTATLGGSDGSFNITASQPYYFDNNVGFGALGPATMWGARLYDRLLSAADVFDIYAAEVADRGAVYSPATELPALFTTATTRFRRTLPSVGARVGSRQIQGYMNG